MIVGDTTQAAAQTRANNQPEQNQGLASDFDTFLQLLTAQIRNQDPLNPADSTEFVAQLATFSNVEQAVQTNDLLKEMSAQMSLQNVSEMSSWVGMEARAVMPVAVDGTEKTLILNTPVVADRAELVVRDTAGQEVQRFSIDPDAAEITWSGASPTGVQLPNDVYNLQIESFSSGNLLGVSSVETFAQVKEAALINGQVILRFPGDIGMPSSSVLGVRNSG